MNSKFSVAADQLLKEGYAVLEADCRLISSVLQIFMEAKNFFQQDTRAKKLAASPELIEGYMPLGSEYSKTAERPDLCESFAVWIRNSKQPQVHSWSQNAPLHARISEVLPLYTKVANGVFDALRERLNPLGERVEASEVSYLQLNYYRPADYSRDLLQDSHEDGHLLTMVKPTAPGVEVQLGGDFIRVPVKDNEILLMPGSLLTLATGGIIPPLYHRVKNDRSTPVRQSLMFFINPPLNRELTPWIENDTNKGVSIREAAVRNSASFGLPSIETVQPK